MQRSDLINPQTGNQYTAKQIQDRWSLPEVPDTIVNVKPDPATKIKVGEAAGKADGNSWGDGGGTQWEMEVPYGKLKKKWFVNQRQLD